LKNVEQRLKLKEKVMQRREVFNYEDAENECDAELLKKNDARLEKRTHTV